MDFKSIQALRAIAAIMVLLMHARIAVWWAKDLWDIPFISAHGMTGVSLFFCISGFIIAHVAEKGDFEPTRFLVKRLWRIAPIYWIVTTLAVLFWYTSNFWQADVDRLGWLGIVKGYLIFPQLGFPLVNPGWSLEHEVIFYILAAFLFPIVRLVGLFVALVILWVVGRCYGGWDYHIFGYPQLYFAAGIAAYWARNVSPGKLAPITVFSFLAVLLVLYKYWTIESYAFVLLMALACSSLIAMLVSLESRGLLFHPWLVNIGDASYSIYIIHWVLLPWIGKMAYHLGGSLELWRWLAFFICLAVGLLSRKYVELPLMRVKFMKSWNSRVKVESVLSKE